MFFWYQHYKSMFFAGFLIVLGFGGYFWYDTLYRHGWSAEEKKTFIEKTFKETVFQEKEFHLLVKSLEERKERLDQLPTLSRDIFTGRPF